MQAGQNRPADVVKDGGKCDLVPVSDPAQIGDPVGRALHVEGVQAESIRGEGEAAVAVEDVVRGGRARDRLDGARAEPLDAVGDAANAPAALELAGRADNRTGEAD